MIFFKNQIPSLFLLSIPIAVTAQIGIFPIIPSVPVASPPIEPSSVGDNDGYDNSNNDNDVGNIAMFCTYAKPSENDRCEFKGACQYNARSCLDETDRNKIIFDVCKCRGGIFKCDMFDLTCDDDDDDDTTTTSCPIEMPIAGSACGIPNLQCNYQPFGCPEHEKVKANDGQSYYGDWLKKCICKNSTWSCIKPYILCPRNQDVVSSGDDGDIGIFPIIPSVPVVPPTGKPPVSSGGNDDLVGIFPIITAAPVVTKPPKQTQSPVTLSPVTSAPVTVPPVTIPPTVEGEGSIENSSTISLCFPGDAIVQVQTSSSAGTATITKMIEDLQIGDKVLVQQDKHNVKYEPVYSFGHKSINRISNEFLEIRTTSTSAPKIVLSKQHMIYEVTQNKFIPVSELQPGHVLQQQQQQKSDSTITTTNTVVASIRSVQKKGMYAPFTPSGTIVINGIVASSYVAIPFFSFMIDNFISYQWIAHAGTFPHRIMHYYFSKQGKGIDAANETYDADGINQSWFISIPFKMMKNSANITTLITSFLPQQLRHWIIIFVTFVTLFTFEMLEQIILFYEQYSITMAAAIGIIIIIIQGIMHSSFSCFGSEMKHKFFPK